MQMEELLRLNFPLLKAAPTVSPVMKAEEALASMTAQFMLED